MRKWTFVSPAEPTLEESLMPLWAPLLAKEPSAPDEYVGHSEGALLDEKGHLLAFVVRLSEKLVQGEPRVFVAKSALKVKDGNLLELSWGEDQLKAQPRFDARLRMHNRVDGGPPVESHWMMPARPGVVPPGEGTNTKEAAKEALEGGLAGAALGAIAGIATGDPVGAVGLAAFFAAGGGIAGAMAGASDETAVEGGEMNLDASEKPSDERTRGVFDRLEEALRDKKLYESGRLRAVRFQPYVRPVEAPQPHA